MPLWKIFNYLFASITPSSNGDNNGAHSLWEASELICEKHLEYCLVCGTCYMFPVLPCRWVLLEWQCSHLSVIAHHCYESVCWYSCPTCNLRVTEWGASQQAFKRKSARRELGKLLLSLQKDFLQLSLPFSLPCLLSALKSNVMSGAAAAILQPWGKKLETSQKITKMWHYMTSMSCWTNTSSCLLQISHLCGT